MVHAVARSAGGFVEALTADYVFTLGGYRVMYLFNWIYRFLTEAHYRNWIVWVAGIVQTGIYCDFFWSVRLLRLSHRNAACGCLRHPELIDAFSV